jgi:hypothetical protein
MKGQCAAAAVASETDISEVCGFQKSGGEVPRILNLSIRWQQRALLSP